MHPASPAGSSRAATAILVALSRSSSGYYFGAAMVLILPWDHSLHQTPGDSNLFTFLDPALTSAAGHVLHRTTPPLEGGPNKAIKELLRTHRGMPEAHARTAVDWLLESATEHPRDPWEIARAQLAEPPQPAAPTPEEPVGPALYDLGFSWEDGNGIQHGWGGRSRP